MNNSYLLLIDTAEHINQDGLTDAMGKIQGAHLYQGVWYVRGTRTAADLQSYVRPFTQASNVFVFPVDHAKLGSDAVIPPQIKTLAAA